MAGEEWAAVVVGIDVDGRVDSLSRRTNLPGMNVKASSAGSSELGARCSARVSILVPVTGSVGSFGSWSPFMLSRS